MNDWRRSSLESAAVYRARVRGCLLGGALGDALGYSVEFSSLDRIRAAHGPKGLTRLVTDRVRDRLCPWPATSVTDQGEPF